ncbi:hypothetical protein DFH09DRAFT_1413883 [Mycena vulgaris]|nr:hypothetical protein DFH09DRAFT_1413883 [Mycena vulgaris]
MPHLHLHDRLKSVKEAVTKSFSRPFSPVQPEHVASPEVTAISARASTEGKTSALAPGAQASSATDPQATGLSGDSSSIPLVVISPPPSIPPVVTKKSTDTKDLAIDTIALALGLLKELAGVVETAPFVAPVATVLLKIIEAYQKTKDAKEKRDVLLGLITDIARDLCNTMSQMKEKKLEALRKRLQPDVEAYIKILEDASKLVAEYDGHGGIYRWAASNHLGDKLSALQSDLDSFGKRFRTNRLLDQSIQQGISQRTLDDVKLMNVQTKLENWLSPPNMAQKQDETEKLWKDGTGQWLLNNDQFVKWQNYAGSLWIRGESGTGKSVLSSAVISTLTEDRRLLGTRGKSSAVAFFYFDFNFKQGQPVETALRRLILQLSAQSPDPYTALDEWWNSSSGQTFPNYKALHEILEQLLRGLGHTYIVLDALDECEQGQNKLLIDLISKLRQWTETPLHLLITSQPRASFTRAFEQVEKVPCIYLPAKDTLEDIRSFVNSRVCAMVEEKSWTAPAVKIVDQLMQKSNGMFRLAACLLIELDGCAWEIELDEILKDLPTDLVGIYDRFLSAIPPKYFAHATAVLRWLLFSARPTGFPTRTLTPVDGQTELADAIAFDFGDPAHPNHRYEPSRRQSNSFAMVGWLNGLVSVNERDGELFLALGHSSVQQYLLDETIKKPFDCDFSASSSHTVIARSCLGYLLHFADRPLNSANLAKYPLALYTANSFYEHLVQCHDPTVLFPEALRLLQNGSKQHSALNHLSNTDHFCRWRANWDIGARTPLYLCSEQGDQGLVQPLLDDGAAIDEPSGGYGTALQAASSKGSTDIVKLLLEKGAHVNAQGGRFGTALQGAAFCEPNSKALDLVRLLLESGADVNAQGGEFGTALKAASLGGFTDVVQLLLDNGADVNADGGTKLSVLRSASGYGYTAIVKLLLERGAHVNARGKTGNDSLQLASREGYLEIVQLLLDNGADANAQGGEYGSALEAALREGHTEVVQILVQRGAVARAELEGEPQVSIESTN